MATRAEVRPAIEAAGGVAARGLRGLRAALARVMPTSGATHEIAALDGLRALAVGLVLWHHVFVALNGNPSNPDLGGRFAQAVAGLTFCGVNLFFVLSGFLLFLPYARAILSGRPLPSVGRFYLRRALRILPVYYAALAVLFLFRDQFMLRHENLRSALLTVLMLHDMRADTFNTVAYQINIAFWTLAAEWQFYLVLPWIALGLAALAGHAKGRAPGRWVTWRLLAGVVLLIIVGLATRAYAASIYYDRYQYFPVETPGWEGPVVALIYGMKGKFLEVFALGMGLAVLYVKGGEQGGLSRRWGAALGVLAVIGCIGGLAGCLQWAIHDHRIPNTIPNGWVFPPEGRLWSIYGEWALGLCFALLLFAVLMGPRILATCFALPPLRFIGVISYSIYVWHLPIIQAYAPIALQHPASAYLRLALWTLLVVPPVCAASYYLIERPFITLRRRAHAPAEVAIAA